MICVEMMMARILILMICRLVFYGENRRYMGRKKEIPVIESVEYDYVGTEEQFRSFIKSIVRDYLVENNLLPDNISDKKIDIKTSA